MLQKRAIDYTARVAYRFPHIDHIWLFFKGRVAINLLQFCFVVCFFLGIALDAKPLNVAVRAKHAFLYNPENGTVLFEKGPHEAHYPASTLKLATALFIIDEKKIRLDHKLIATSQALQSIHASVKQANFLIYPAYLLEHDGVIIGLEEGGSYTMEMLLHGLLLFSGNDAANVIAEGLSGSIDQFMRELNCYLKRKGILNTRLQNPHGLHHPAQLSTAHDLAKIAALCFENELFRKVIRTVSFEDSSGRLIKNTNWMLQKGNRYYYPPFIGGKTGYVASSGCNLVGAAQKDGRMLIAVLLGCESRADCFKDAITLFEAAFCQKKEERILFAKEHGCFKHPLKNAASLLEARLEQDLALSYYPAEESELSAKIVWKRKKLPILEGEEVAELVVLNEHDCPIAAAPLFALHTVEKVTRMRWLIWLALAAGVVAVLVQLLKKRHKLFKG